MAIPSSGVPISMDTLNTEFGGGFALSSYYRGGSFVPSSPQNTAIPTSGTISLGNFYGSSNRMIVSLTASGNNYDVYTNRGPSYQAGKTDLTVTVPGTIGSTSTGTYAMLVPSAFSPTDTVTIVNNGVIQGMGGAGSDGAPSTTPATTAASGGNAVYVNRPTIITNNGTIAGGGGGGGGGGGAAQPSKFVPQRRSAGGGGGGGGAGTNGGAAGAGGTAAAGGVASSGAPGGAGTSPAGGGGGAGGSASPAIAGAGGAGGGRGAVGTAGAVAPSGPQKRTPGGGGGAGNYLVGNAFVTWPATGTRQGGVA